MIGTSLKHSSLDGNPAAWKGCAGIDQRQLGNLEPAEQHSSPNREVQPQKAEASAGASPEASAFFGQENASYRVKEPCKDMGTDLCFILPH